MGLELEGVDVEEIGVGNVKEGKKNVERGFRLAVYAQICLSVRRLRSVMANGDAAAALSSSFGTTNLSLISALLACAIAQFLKPFITWLKDKKWDSKKMVSSGGMPSSHSAMVTALATAIGLEDGIGGSSFAIAVVLASVVCTF
ncbi:hypothetical protein M569_13564 [Genlisea aurea]|uniref:Acid phosphatase/vanadium-dependent haloperoxidase-related protein n=1 Tax=Genlisea aurea TaxID=192259 RepID=S8DEL6_9LAMI|nr:hypothetical protein M569_13564 [Genlisea aurea]